MGEKKSSEKNISSRAKSIIALAVCLVIAFGMWLYVMTVDSPEWENVFDGVTVELTGADGLAKHNLAIYSGYGIKVDVTLSGKKSTLSKFTSDDIIVTADVSAVEASGRYNIKLSVDTPAGCKLVGMSQDTMPLYVDEAAQAVVSLVEQRENTSLPEGCFADEITVPVDMVTVTGPLSLLNKIKSALVTIDMSGVTKTTVLTEQIILVDAGGAKIDNPYIDYYPREISVEVPILKTVKVPIEVQFKNGFLSYDNTVVSVVPAAVEVTGDAELIGKGELVAPIVIDEKTAFETGRFDSVVALEPYDGVELSINKAKVSVVLKSGYTTKEFTVAEDSIRAEGAADGVDFSWKASPMTVTLLGPEDILREISDEELSAVLDLSPYSDTNTGTVRVKAEIRVDSEYNSDVLPVGQYHVNVTFK